MHAKLERLLSKSLTTLEVMAYYLVVHTGPGGEGVSLDSGRVRFPLSPWIFLQVESNQ